jgi:hypothetical protein
VSAGSVVILRIRAEHVAQVSLAEDGDVIKALPPD